MPYAERLTWDGVALHAGGLPGFPESHGCVHLPLEFSKLLFGITPMGGTVVIAGHAGSVTLTTDAGVLAPVTATGTRRATDPLAPGEAYRWTPQVSPTGPVTVIVSRSDQRAVVLRNGKEIGRARVTLPDGDFQTHVLTLTANAAGQRRWILVGVPGHADENGQPVDAGVLAQAQFPAAFLADLQAIEEPGMTVLVTQSPVLPDNSGGRLTVMDSTGK